MDPICPICQTTLKHVADGCMTDRGWKDESYFICPTHGEVDEEEDPLQHCALSTAHRALHPSILPATEEAIQALNLTKEDLLTFQREIARQGRNWQLTLIKAHEAGVPTYPRLMDYTEATRPPGFFWNRTPQ
jgi:hypothetical protein